MLNGEGSRPACEDLLREAERLADDGTAVVILPLIRDSDGARAINMLCGNVRRPVEDLTGRDYTAAVCKGRRIVGDNARAHGYRPA